LFKNLLGNLKISKLHFIFEYNRFYEAMKRMRTTYKRGGFSLIELMVVVAIIGVLAAIAIPAYQSYVIKAKLAYVVSDLQAASVPAVLFYQTNGTFNNYQGSTNSLSQYTASLGWNTAGSGGKQLQLIAQVQNINSAVNGFYLYLILSTDNEGDISMCCGAKSGNTTFPSQYFPPGCNSICPFAE